MNNRATIHTGVSTIVLTHGPHESREAGLCAMEAVAWLAGERHSDSPECVCPVIAAAMRALNDGMDDADRQRLVPYLKRVIGTRGDRELETRRRFAAADWAVRVAAPRALRALRAFALDDEAARLEALAPVVDVSTARTAQREASAVSCVASAAASAASVAAAACAAADTAYAAAGYVADDAYGPADAAAGFVCTELLDRLLEVT